MCPLFAGKGFGDALIFGGMTFCPMKFVDVSASPSIATTYPSNSTDLSFMSSSVTVILYTPFGLSSSVFKRSIEFIGAFSFSFFITLPITVT